MLGRDDDVRADSHAVITGGEILLQCVLVLRDVVAVLSLRPHAAVRNHINLKEKTHTRNCALPLYQERPMKNLKAVSVSFRKECFFPNILMLIAEHFDYENK